jgi:hypothetical protein
LHRSTLTGRAAREKLTGVPDRSFRDDEIRRVQAEEKVHGKGVFSGRRQTKPVRSDREVMRAEARLASS